MVALVCSTLVAALVASAYVPVVNSWPGQGAGLVAQTAQAIEAVDVNKANEEQLQVVKGIGPAMAKRIVEWRTQNGRFERLDDLLNVRGIGVKTLNKLRPYLKLGEKKKDGTGE